MPYFTIIIPAYNAEKTILKCLDSIRNQTFSDFEAIIINDGSIDKTSLIINSYAKIDSRFKVINKKNEGVSIARNLGLKMAQGKYIAFIDSDDFIHPDYLKIFSLFNTDIIIGGYKCFGKNSNIYEPISFYSDNHDEIRNFFYHHFQNSIISASIFCVPWGKVFKTDFIRKLNIEFDYSIRCGEDIIFNLKAFSKTNKLKVINSALYNYYESSTQKYILNFKEYKLHANTFDSNLKLFPKGNNKNLKEFILGCYWGGFCTFLWNSTFSIGFKNALLFHITGMQKYIPYYGLKKIRKGLSLIIIPLLRLFKR